MVNGMNVSEWSTFVSEPKFKILDNSGWGAFIITAHGYYLFPKFYLYRETGKYLNLGFYFCNYNFAIQWNKAFQVESC